MMRRQVFGGMLAVAAIAVYALPARAAFHLWSISEIYSNSDGSVQFIELFSSSPFQTNTSSPFAHIDSTATGHVFTFSSDLSVDTTNKHMLLATAGFGSLAGGVTPDFTIPSHFFNPAGDTITFANTLFPPATFGATPTDGVHSFSFPGGSTIVNSPTNLAGAPGSVNLPPPVTPTGDYNGNGIVDAADYVLWRKTFGQLVSNGTAADGSGNGTIDNADYTFWASKFGNVLAGSAAGATDAGAVPEPATLALIAAGILVLCYRRHTTAS
jgi:PEP-CTERM motif